MKEKVYKVKYEMAHGGGVEVSLPFNPRKGKCDSCGKVVGKEIKVTALHHWYYKYKPETVKNNPILAIENTSELCFTCHKIGDALRLLLYNQPSRINLLLKCIKNEEQQLKIKLILKTMLETLNNIKNAEATAKNISMDNYTSEE